MSGSVSSQDPKLNIGDHRLTLVDFVYEPDDKGKGKFYFDQRLLEKAGVEKFVEKGWNVSDKDGDTSLLDRINSCRTAFARWKRSLHMNSLSH